MTTGISPLFNVRDLDKSLEFYRTLGLSTRRQNQTAMRWGEVRSGDGLLMLYPMSDLAPGQPADTLAWLSGELGKGVMVNVGVANARAAWEKARKARFTVDTALEAQPWGGFGFTLVDPDGYVVAFSDRWPAEKPARKSKATKAGTTATRTKAPTKKSRAARKGTAARRRTRR